MKQPDPTGYREPSPPTSAAPWNPRAVRAFRFSLASVLLVLARAIAGLPKKARERTAADDGAWERWGIHGHALEADAYDAALTDARRRVGGLAATDAESAVA